MVHLKPIHGLWFQPPWKYSSTNQPTNHLYPFVNARENRKCLKPPTKYGFDDWFLKELGWLIMIKLIDDWWLVQKPSQNWQWFIMTDDGWQLIGAADVMDIIIITDGIQYMMKMFSEDWQWLVMESTMACSWKWRRFSGLITGSMWTIVAAGCSCWSMAAALATHRAKVRSPWTSWNHTNNSHL